MRISDWSSDVCSSDLIACPGHQDAKRFRRRKRSMSRTPKHAVILCHPKRDSFNGAVADAYCAAVRDIGHEVCLRDLYRSEEHTSELQSLMRISYAVFCLKKKKNTIALK